MDLLTRNRLQRDEALGSINRYYFWLVNQRDPIDDNELMLFYVKQGGAADFAKRHPHERRKK